MHKPLTMAVATLPNGTESDIMNLSVACIRFVFFGVQFRLEEAGRDAAHAHMEDCIAQYQLV
jgi:hypothetical protein